MTGILLEHVHGAVTRVGVRDTAVQHREPSYNLMVASMWMDPSVTDSSVRWTKETYATLEPYFVNRRYLSYLNEDEIGQAAGASYGPEYEGIAHLKAKYDPENVFHVNLNVEPAANGDR
jgi:Berberine and berberine like